MSGGEYVRGECPDRVSYSVIGWPTVPDFNLYEVDDQL